MPETSRQRGEIIEDSQLRRQWQRETPWSPGIPPSGLHLLPMQRGTAGERSSQGRRESGSRVRRERGRSGNKGTEQAVYSPVQMVARHQRGSRRGGRRPLSDQPRPVRSCRRRRPCRSSGTSSHPNSGADTGANTGTVANAGTAAKVHIHASSRTDVCTPTGCCAGTDAGTCTSSYADTDTNADTGVCSGSDSGTNLDPETY